MDNVATAGIIGAFDDLADDFDVVIVDIAAGISPSVLTFLAACQRRFIVVKDEPASIADAYGTIKVMTRDYGLDEIYLIPNMVSSQAAGWQLYRRLNEVCNRFLAQSVSYLTSIEADEFVLQALRKYTSVIQHAPGGAAARDFMRLADAVNKLPPVTAPNGHIQFFVDRLAQTAEKG
jgi:flagellar biosynthesis protein FlhG